MCHPPTAGRSLRSPRQSHPPLAPGLALRSAAGSPVPAQWQEAGGKWQSLSTGWPKTLVDIPTLLPGALPSLQTAPALSVLSLGDPHWELTFPICSCFAPTISLFTPASLQVTPD